MEISWPRCFFRSFSTKPALAGGQLQRSSNSDSRIGHSPVLPLFLHQTKPQICSAFVVLELLLVSSAVSGSLAWRATFVYGSRPNIATVKLFYFDEFKTFFKSKYWKVHSLAIFANNIDPWSIKRETTVLTSRTMAHCTSNSVHRPLRPNHLNKEHWVLKENLH